ncbi:TPA: morphogenetic protein [Klebsiella pneumoniae]|nr:morphogenetic protein [Klebsiella pneumoniae]
MKERGMIFNGEMVRALLSGRKTQTRREVKLNLDIACLATTYDWATSLAANHYQGLTEEQIQQKAESLRGVIHPVILANGQMVSIICPHGKPGDRIWVRETWARYNIDQNSHDIAYRATTPEDWPEEGYWRPSIHMPRWASRILLEITDVRVERLNAISEEDAEAEGIDMEALYDSQDCYDCIADHNMTGRPTVTGAFKYLWESIYGEEGWKSNPWVWVIEFKRVEGGAA